MRVGNLDDVHQPSKMRSTSPYLLWLIWIIWLPFFIPAILELIQSRPTLPHLIASLAGAAVFFGFYLWATWRNVQRLIAIPSPPESTVVSTWLPIIVLVLLCLALAPGNGPDWGDLFIFTSAYIAGRLPTMRAALAVAAFTLLTIIFARLGGVGWSTLVPGIIYIIVVGVVTISIVRAIMASRELRAAREEIARLAVTAERLRIARDLHDLLGHNLSLIALKSELARNLVGISPERAAAEIGDVENVARTTLQEVREAVASYRQPTLAGELHAAQEILAAAGIMYRYEGDDAMMDNLPTAIEAVLSWTVREGVTNVIKHSRARHCAIHGTRTKDDASVSITDDGTSPAIDSGSGNGLRGLAERVAALGGRFEAGPRSGGGFRLVVSLPLARRENEPHHSGASTDLDEQQAAAIAPPYITGSIERSEQQ